MDEVEISIAELREAAGRLLDAAERLFGSSVNLQVDDYLGLFSPEMFGADGSDPALTGRSLADDVASIRELLGRADLSEDRVLLWRDLDHLVGVLQRISALAS